MTDFLVQLDRHLLLTLNGSDSRWLDHVFLLVTQTSTWLPLMGALLWVAARRRPWAEVACFVAALALVVLVADQFSSGFCKPFFHRFRPSHEPALEGLVDLVDGRCGGPYGFISSHAANTFGAFAFIALWFRRKTVTLTVLLWALLSSYSRIYLGLHYPGDILCGALWGLFTGGAVYTLVRRAGGKLARFGAEGRTVGAPGPQGSGPKAAGFGAGDGEAAPSGVWLLPATLAATLAAAGVAAAL